MQFACFIMPLVLMMRTRENDHSRVVFLLFLLAILSLSLLGEMPGFSGAETSPYDKEEFIQITGDIINPGVYAFSRPQNLESLLNRCGGLVLKKGHVVAAGNHLYHSGTKLEILSGENGPLIIEHEISAFHKLTLGIPVSLNREGVEGLTALPGIGCAIADAIVRVRVRRGGFERTDDLLAVRGIGPRLLEKLSSCLVL